MNVWIIDLIIAAVLVAAELLYFRIADKCNIIDRPNERSSHTKVVIRGGGIIFTIGLWVWSAFSWFQYPWLLAAVTLAAVVSFVDDIRSLPDSVRLVAQFVAMGLLLAQLVLCNEQLAMSWWGWGLAGMAALIVCVGATNIYNFMDGINGITAGYSLAVLIPLMLVNGSGLFRIGDLENCVPTSSASIGFVESSLMLTVLLSVLVFSFFNFRPKNKAKCFAGDVGSVGIAFILLFMIGALVMKTKDVTWLIFLIVYGVDGCCTILHRIMLHENLGEAHRKHAYQILSNEVTEWAFGPNQPSDGRFWKRLLGKAENGHVVVSLLYMGLQLVISLGFIYFCPNTVLAHWVYLAAVAAVLVVLYVVFMKKYYHLHEEHLAEQKRK